MLYRGAVPTRRRSMRAESETRGHGAVPFAWRELQSRSAPLPTLRCAFGSLTSLHRRDDELGAFLRAGGPARGHRLGLGIEAHRVRTVLVQVAEARTLP